MKAAAAARWLGGIVLALAAFAAQAGGPLTICYTKPVKYPGTGTVSLNYDQGALGVRSKAQADALVTSSVSLWTNVGTATVNLARGADLPVDVTSANYTTYYGNFTDGLNPVIYDTDGSIIDSLLGIGAKSSVLGFAGSGWYDYGTYCEYAEGRAVLNGYLSVSDATMGVVIAHEVGHLIGLDHTQIDSTQGLATSNYPLMYPIAYRSTASLHEDDVAAVTALYPDTNVSAAYGELTGTFTQVNGTPIRGANIWAQGAAGTFSVVSDYLEQGTGYFRLLLPPGTYTLHAEAIDSQFTGGSSVGPYSETTTSPSFTAPLYVNGVAMAPVTLGGSSPTQITITAGCAANATFHNDSTGSIGGNCVQSAKSNITSPTPGSTLTGASATFTWDAGTNVTERYLIVGTTASGSEIYAGYQGTAMSRTVSGIPTNGSTIYVRLLSWINGAWQTNSYTYTAATMAAKSNIVSPAPGSTLPGATVTFAWDSGSLVTDRQLSVGTFLNGGDIYQATQGTALSHMVTGIPTDGRVIYVRFQSLINGVWQANNYTYAAASIVAVSSSNITSPTPGSTLPGSSVTFSWDAGSGVSTRYLAIGTALNGQDLYSAYVGASSQTVTGLPTNGSTVYVRLFSWINGNWDIRYYTYTAANTAPAPVASNMTSPTPGSTLPGSSVTFSWDAGSGVSTRYLAIGTALNGQDVYSAYVGASSQTVTGLSTNGSTVYVRLFSWINGNWVVNNYTYTAANMSVAPVPSNITSPAPGSTLPGSTVTFSWDSGTGVSTRYLAIGTALNGQDLYSAYVGDSSQTVTGLPTNGSTIYVRLFSWINGNWQINYYTYTAFH